MVQLARHQDRPQTLDYIAHMLPDFLELSGDRLRGDDSAIVGGLGTLGERRIVLVGHQKGHTLEERQERSFGMARPEGYRKAMRLARLAEKFGLPLVTLVDTGGAYPGKDAEEGGQAGAIATSIMTFTGLKIPTVTVVIGEGGSGGALALAVCDRVFMLENSIYSVISPEGCARPALARLGRRAPKAAEALRPHRHGPVRAGAHRRGHPRADRRRAHRSPGHGQAGDAPGATGHRELESWIPTSACGCA